MTNLPKGNSVPNWNLFSCDALHGIWSMCMLGFVGATFCEYSGNAWCSFLALLFAVLYAAQIYSLVSARPLRC